MLKYLSLVTIGGNYVCYIGLLEGTVTKWRSYWLSADCTPLLLVQTWIVGLCQNWRYPFVWISVYHVGPNGWTKLSGDDVGELHYKYYPVEATPVEQEMADAPAAWTSLCPIWRMVSRAVNCRSALVYELVWTCFSRRCWEISFEISWCFSLTLRYCYRKCDCRLV